MTAKERIDRAYNSFSGILILFLVASIICQLFVVYNLIDNYELLRINIFCIYVIIAHTVVCLIQFSVYRSLSKGNSDHRYKGVTVKFVICIVCLCFGVFVLSNFVSGSVYHTGTYAIYISFIVNAVANVILLLMALSCIKSIQKYIVEENRTIE